MFVFENIVAKHEPWAKPNLGVNWLGPKHFKGARLALHHQHIWPKEDFLLAVGASSHARAQLALARARCSDESSRLALQPSIIPGVSIG